MKSHPNGAECSNHCFYGTATVGERGQIVIPAEARDELGFLPGDKLLVMKHPLHQGVMIFKIEAAQQFLADMQESFNRLQRDVNGKETTPK